MTKRSSRAGRGGRRVAIVARENPIDARVMSSARVVPRGAFVVVLSPAKALNEATLTKRQRAIIAEVTQPRFAARAKACPPTASIPPPPTLTPEPRAFGGVAFLRHMSDRK